MQIKAGFKKEWLQFSRTFRFGGMLLATLSFAFVDPLLIWLMESLVNSVMDGGTEEIFSLLGGSGLAESSYSGVLSELASTSMVIIMLIMMSPCGGEQKKRATIIPSCTGLGYFEYLVPKFVLYPLTVFVCGFASSCIGGGMSALLFGGLDVGIVLLGAVLCSVYMAFIMVLYMALGLCTNRPGIMTAVVYAGIPLVSMILTGLDLTDYHPLTLRTLVTGGMFEEGFSAADNAASIIVGVLLSIVISVLLFVLTYAVQKGKKINNQEDKPEF